MVSPDDSWCKFTLIEHRCSSIEPLVKSYSSQRSICQVLGSVCTKIRLILTQKNTLKKIVLYFLRSVAIAANSKIMMIKTAKHTKKNFETKTVSFLEKKHFYQYPKKYFFFTIKKHTPEFK